MNGERDHRRWRAELAAYALGSLEDGERETVERHLDTCEACRDDLRWLQPAIDVLPESVPQLDPPRQLRERLLAEVREDARPVPVAGPAAQRPARKRSGGFRRFLLRPAIGLAAVALLGAAVAGYSLHSDGEKTTTIASHGEGRVKATLERSGDSGTLQLTGLRQPPSSEVYQAWVQHGKRIQPSTLFDTRRDGSASVALPHQLAGADAVMVTVERRGGTRKPTPPSVIRLGLSG